MIQEGDRFRLPRIRREPATAEEKEEKSEYPRLGPEYVTGVDADDFEDEDEED